MNFASALPAYSPACQQLAEVSQRIGDDPLLIQAAGGNTSVKEDDTLWVKASGLWLRDALRRPMFVPVSLPQVRARMAAGEADPVGPTVRRELAVEGLRPSIETTLHALMPHAVVLHVHSVDAIACAVQPEARTALAGALDGVRWGWIGYHRPGLPLTLAVAALAAERPIDVLLMGNHGRVVGGDSTADAPQRLADVVARLRRPVRAAPPADARALAVDAAGTGWALPAHARSHAVATDPVNLARAARGVLYPDHVVFLGSSLACAPALAGTALQDWLRAQRRLEIPAPYIALPGRGVLARNDLPEAAQEMLACLADVLQRLPAAHEPVYLPDEEADSLADWEAEKFRKTQAR